MHAGRRSNWSKKMRNNAQGKVFVDREHGVYDSRNEYGRVLVREPRHADVAAADELMLAEARRQMMMVTRKSAIASTPAPNHSKLQKKADILDTLQKNMKVMLKKKKRKASSSVNLPTTGADANQTKKCKPTPPTVPQQSSASSALLGLGSYDSDSDNST